MTELFDRLMASGNALLSDVIECAMDEVGPKDKYGSPIEVAFAVATAALCATRFPKEIAYLAEFGMSDSTMRGSALASGDHYVWVAPQVQISSYRVDFLALHLRGLVGFGGVVVELDGHEFHERTKDQAARDKARDRDLQDMGFKVFRFTGSEVWRDPFACAHGVLMHAHSIAVDAAHARHLISIGDVDGARKALSWLH